MAYADPQPVYQAPHTPASRQNTLGVIAFVCALAGLLTGGHLLSPIGLILSLVALGSRPRGFAVAALILGLLGTCGWAIVVLLIVVLGLGVALAMVGVFFFSQADRIELTTDMSRIVMQADEYKQANRGIPPADLSVLNLQPSTLLDPWGNRYRYELVAEEPGYDIVSDGPDGAAGTADDVRLSRLDRYWQGAAEDFERQLKEFERRQRDRASRGADGADGDDDRAAHDEQVVEPPAAPPPTPPPVEP